MVFITERDCTSQSVELRKRRKAPDCQYLNIHSTALSAVRFSKTYARRVTLLTHPGIKQNEVYS